MGCISSKPQVASPSNHSFSEASYSGTARAESSQRRPLRYGELPGPPAHSNLTYYQQSLVGVARWPDPKYNRDDSPHQMEYGRSFFNASRDAGAGIASGEVKSFSQVWALAQRWRAEAAGGDHETFGENSERYPTYNHTGSTPLAEQYAYILERYKNRTDGELAEEIEGLPVLEFPLRDEIEGNHMALSTIVMSTDPNANRHDKKYLALSHLEAGQPFYIRHTYSADVPKILSHVEKLYEHALDPTISDSKSLKILAEVHWWVANAMPDHRGSAAKTEFSVRAMAMARGMELPPMKNGIVPDLEAMTMPREEFVMRYSNFFDH
ncbi:type III effector [Pseudomonas syringae group genomosp. 3]|nr:type III effector [Pseudomonas syringae group genomosp. 3]